MADLPSVDSLETPGRRRLVEDEEEIIRRLSAEAKLRIYEEIKELFEAKAARDAVRAGRGDQDVVVLPTDPEPPSRFSRAVRAQLGSASSGAPRRDADKEDSASDLVILHEGGSYRLDPDAADVDSALDPSRISGRASSKRKAGKAKKSKSDASPKRDDEDSPLLAPLTAEKKRTSRRFTLLTGLTQEQVKLLRESGSRQKFDEGQTIFSSGDKAEGVYVILRGRVEVAMETGGLDHLSTRRSGEWFGELELINGASHRRATARAIRATSLFEVAGNPLELFRWMSDRKAAMRLLRNSICLMSRHLREMGEVSAKLPGKQKGGMTDSSPTGNWEEARKLLPPGLMDRVDECRSFKEMRLLDGQHLYREGDKAKGMYFIQAGTLDVFRKSGKRQRKLSTLEGPMVIGDVSFFSNHDRSVSVRAFGPVRLLKFSGERFERVKNRDPEETLDLLLLGAELAAGLQRIRQGVSGH